MSRDAQLWIQDILEACRRIQDYVAGLDQETFEADTKTFDAVLRNLEVIGEAVKALPDGLRKAHPNVAWRKISGLRDIVIHQYFGVDSDIIWDVIQNKVPELEEQIKRIANSGS